MTPEGAIKQAVKAYLQKTGWFEFTISQFNKRGYRVKSGISDLIAVGGDVCPCCKRGRTVFTEIKTLEGAQSPAQAEFQAMVMAHGGEYHVIRSVGELKTVIKHN